ncbi:AraC family transcriptional regulator [Catenovulum sp. 2E275]|uniref:AraC family transcriptional regulator n=1 Tax=Catenovulum sp. 2E275 TaxID=2980497 RepID=UPI0021D37699|nr:AraC family transcriptional regulator [Catenovulum sp. 2E275]MCU4674082.1 AraC family transcriptional regulator [Catenovulum sp. 2E275]
MQTTSANQNIAPALQASLNELAELLKKLVPHDGKSKLNIPNCHVVKSSKTNLESIRVASKRGICIVAQGAKRVMLGESIYQYDASQIAIYSAEAPVASNVIRASVLEPYLCFVMEIDPQQLSELSLKVFPNGMPQVKNTQAIYISDNDKDLVDCAIKLVKLHHQPDKADLISPLIVEEILLRLLTSPIGSQIAQIGAENSNIYKISKAINWLRNNYPDPVKVEDLANKSNMSPSSFFQHFKQVTSMSPLQFQKSLRLQEARYIMLNKMLDVNTASSMVGYTSVSQFSREYSRYFGVSPSKDVASIRNQKHIA